jgi:hypothetical protein
MNKWKFIIISFVLISIAILFYSIRIFTQQSFIENKVLELLPEHPQLVVNFKNPDELYNKYIGNNLIFKKLQFSDKSSLLKIIQQADSLNRIFIQNDIKIQDYSYYFIKYQDDEYLFAFVPQNISYKNKIEKIITPLNYSFTEINGNYFIHHKNKFNKNKSTNLENKWLLEWFNIFSKSPAPLHIYQHIDTTEIAFQTQFEFNKITLNGFLNYKNFKSYINYKELNFDDELIIESFNFVDNTNDSEFSDFITTFKNNYLYKKICNKNINFFPFKNYESFSDILKNLSDSVIIINDLEIYKIKSMLTDKFIKDLQLPSDSIIYALLTENNICFSNHKESLILNSKLLSQDFSDKSFYFHIQKNIIQLPKNKYLPLSINITKDTSTFNLYTEIYSSYSNRYFTFHFEIEQNTSLPQILWVFENDKPIQNITGFFDDHKTHNYFILIQDSTNTLIALNSNGEKNWTYSLKHPIFSEIHIVDILKNNKHQILFNTSYSIYLIDRNGKNVGRFPLNFTSPITTPISVLDYQKNKNYRIWFSTQNHYTYNYTLDGNKAENYRPYYYEETFIHSPKYLSIGQSDYIVLISEKGSIIGISRKGDGRIKLKNKLPPNALDYFFDVSNTLQNSYIYYCTANSLERISFTDQHKIIHQFQNDTLISAKFFKNKLTEKPVLAGITKHQLKLYSLSSEEILSIPTDTVYQHLSIQQSDLFTYIILSQNNYHTIIRFNIDNTINVLQKKLFSTTLPKIQTLFKNQMDYIIFCNVNKVYCKQLK